MAEVAYKPVGKVNTKLYEGRIEPPKYYPSYYEFLTEVGTNVFASRGDNYLLGQTITFYTVPEGYTLFITSSHWTTDHNGFTNFAAAGYSLHLFFSIMNESNSYKYPIILNQFETITGYCAIAGWAGGGFSGFLVPNSLIVAI